MKNIYAIGLIAFVMTSLVFSAGGAGAADVEKMTKEELKTMLGNPDVIIVDVRQPSHYQASKAKIQGAVREDPSAVTAWMKNYPKDKTLVFYCA
jgi:3-mercaptopyruvate sulfurtransferase SseA